MDDGGDAEAMTTCTRMLPGEPYDVACGREAVWKGYCWPCAWVELPEERGELPERVRAKRVVKLKKAKRAHPEDDLQMQCCELLASLPGTLFWSTPNHFYLGAGNPFAKARYIEKQKMMGMNPGATDLNVVFRNKNGASTLLLCELKIKPNKPSPEQRSFMDTGNSLGAYTACCYTFEEFLGTLKTAKHPAF